MLLVVRIFVLLALLFANVAHARSLRILVLGEAAAANCNVQLYKEQPGVFQVGLDGLEKPARDPLEWADCKGGSVWIPLGRDMVRSGLAEKVVFMPVAVAGSHALDWGKGGRAFAKLEASMRVAKAQRIRFDYVFWYQGLSDGAASEQKYFSDLIKVMRAMIPAVPGAKWLVAKSAGCDGKVNEDILAAQRQAASNPLYNRFPGPDVYLVRVSSFADQCTLKNNGQEEVAELWLNSVENAEAASRNYQRESLLDYFK